MSEPSTRSQSFTDLSVPRAYEASLALPVFTPWARLLLDFTGLPAGASVLDVASGTGVVARMVAQQLDGAGAVTVTDISPAMLMVAQEHLPQDSSVRTVVCSADALAAPDASQDVVFCQQGIQFFPDQPAALREMRRVLRPGGRVGIAVWAAEHPIGVFEPIIRGVERFISAPYPRAFDPRSFAMTAEDLETALRAAGFSAVHVEQRSVTATWDTLAAALATVQATPYGPAVAKLAPDQQAAAHQAIAAAFGDQITDGRVSCPTFAHLARAVA